MASVDLVASTVMDKSASLLNDTAQTTYTYTAQLPYLNIALQELQEHFELNDIPVTEDVSAVIQMDAGDTEIVFNGAPGVPTLPDDFIEPNQVWERARDIDPWVPMTRRDYLPHGLEGVLSSRFVYFVWQAQKIQVLPANQDNDIKIDYIRQLFTEITGPGGIINVINAATFLQYRTAALCAEFIERNQTNADALNVYAVLALDRVTGIGVKSKQTIMTRRRPFRASYKRRGYAT